MPTKEINPVPKLNNDTGFSTTGIINGSRFINRDGTFNLHKKGWPFWERFSIFYTMISLPLWQFIVIIVAFFFSINLLYTGIYWLIGAEQFTGFVAHTPAGIFKELYFFSTETFTTVGYGPGEPCWRCRQPGSGCRGHERLSFLCPGNRSYLRTFCPSARPPGF